LLLHDWVGGLGFNYAVNHKAQIRGIAFWETFVRTFDKWADWPQDLLEGFQAFRQDKVGWDLIINQNVFMKEVLPYGIHRDLSQERDGRLPRPARRSQEPQDALGVAQRATY
jgi:haloalkane dehalogenase